MDKMSFEQAYDARQADNYPQRGKRQGAFVLEQVEPKPPVGTKNRPNLNRGTSMWDVMHQNNEQQQQQQAALESKPPQQPRGQQNYQLQKPQSSKPDLNRNGKRRDPIGYFDDERFGGSMGQEMPNVNPGPNFNQNIKANTREQYNPSWGSNPQLQQQQPMMHAPMPFNPNEPFYPI